MNCTEVATVFYHDFSLLRYIAKMRNFQKYRIFFGKANDFWALKILFLRILIDTFILPNIEKNADKIADALYCVVKYLIFSDGLQVEGDV